MLNGSGVGRLGENIVGSTADLEFFGKDMLTAARLAGFFTAHAIWCVSEEDTLIPMLAHIDGAGERQMRRLAMEDTRQAVEKGQEIMATNEMEAKDAALLFDGLINNEEANLDAVVVEFRDYSSPESSAVIAVPYGKADGKFRVYKPKLLGWNNCEKFEINEAIQEFFNGVGEHEKGAKVWEDSLDESK